MISILLSLIIAAQCQVGWMSQYSPAVCTIGGQWQRTTTGEIEAWYTAEQLRLCLVAMEMALRAPSAATG